ncbi:hypothetical protein RND81_10G111700 [Saponaria officinalis]|uniref:Protein DETOXIFICATION n=1 Tax=Saponaria officinalis TaxID=3572 RepID=A0AAW1I0Z8_SAPOF
MDVDDTDARPSDFPLFVFFKDVRNLFKWDPLGTEILQIALPAALALAADPVASLIDTVFIGHLGPVELAAVGVSIAIFNQASKITIYPLVSITTSFVAEEETENKITEKHEATKTCISEDSETQHDDTAFGEELQEASSTPFTSVKKLDYRKVGGKRHIPSASTALVLGGILGLLQTIFLIFGSDTLLGIMGVKHGSPMISPAHKYLTIRSLGAPAVLLSLAMQGVFRGLKDTKTPLYATVAADGANIILDPIFIFACHLGVSGAAIAHVMSQYLMAFILLWNLTKQVDLLPPSLKDLQFGRFLKNGFYLFTRVIAVTFCVTLAASLAARLGATPMAAFQICLQVWLTSSLLADGLAIAGQAILACAFAEKDYEKATAAAARVLQMGFILGLGLAVVVGAGLQFGAGVFTTDVNVLHYISIGVPFVAATQPINSLSFVFDGVNFGASDFAYSAYSMVLVAVGSIASLFLLSRSYGFVGIWIALTIYMALRTFAGIWRMGTGTGPWRFLKSKTYF